MILQKTPTKIISLQMYLILFQKKRLIEEYGIKITIGRKGGKKRLIKLTQQDIMSHYICLGIAFYVILTV